MQEISIQGSMANQIAALITNGELSLEDMRSYLLQAKELMCYYRCVILEIETKFRVLDEEFSLQHERNPIHSIKSRVKSPESIVAKMQRKNIPLTLKDMETHINDIAGIRVVCSFIDDVYALADSFKQQDDVRVLQIKDYIKEPKSNGYQSLHMIVEVPVFLHNRKKYIKAEIQFRTIAMEFWSELEHKLRYKKDINPDTLNRISDELYLCAQISADNDRRMQMIRDELNKAEQNCGSLLP